VDGVLKQLPFPRVLIAPVDCHEKTAPWHSWRDGVAQCEVVKALEHLADLAGLGNDHDLFEDRDWPEKSQEAEKDLQEPHMTEEKTRRSINKQLPCQAN